MNGSRPASFAVLVIDDEPQFCQFIAELLEAEGHRVLVATSGEDGLAMMKTIRPDLILVDHFMPGLSGLEVVRRLKADVQTRSIPIVAVTSGTTEEEAKALSLAGCVAFVPKPFEPDSFLQLVAGILNVTAWRDRRGASRS